MSVSIPTPLDRVRWLPFDNTSSSAAAPACACMAIGGVTLDQGQAVLQCGQFTSTGPFAFNGLQQVAAGAQGQCTQDYPLLALYDSSATPTLGDTWVPKSGQWSLTKGAAGAANGYIVLGPVDTTAQTMWVTPAANNSTTAVVAVIDTPGVAFTLPSNPYGQAVWAGVIVTPQMTAPTFADDSGGNRYSPSPTPTLSSASPTCWILDVDGIGGSGSPSPTLINGEMYIGIAVGSYTIGTQTLPLYAVRKGGQSDVVSINSNNLATASGGSSTASQVVNPAVASGPLFDVTVMTQLFAGGIGNFSSGVPAWLYFVDWNTQGVYNFNISGESSPAMSAAVAPTIVCGDNYVARLVGSYDPYPGDEGGTSSLRPLYMCRAGAGRQQGGTLIYSQAAYGLPSSEGYYDCKTLDGRKVWFACSDIHPFSLAAGVAPTGSEECYSIPPVFFFTSDSLIYAFPEGAYDPYPGGSGGTSDPRPLFTASAKASGLLRRLAATVAGWVSAGEVTATGGFDMAAPYLPCTVVGGVTNVKFRVFCPTDSYLTGRVPSIEITSVPVVYEQCPEASLAAIAVTDVLDAPIGTVRMALMSVGTIQMGWGLMDGTHNSSANGGSGINMVSGNPGYYGGGYIPRGAPIGGASSPSGSDDFDATMIADHVDHAHAITTATGSPTGSSGAVAVSGTTDGSAVISGSGDSTGEQLKHAANAAGGRYYPGGNLPATQPFLFIERLNNSQSTVV